MKITCSKSKTIYVLNYLPGQKAPRKYAATGKEGGSGDLTAGDLRIRRCRMHYNKIKKKKKVCFTVSVLLKASETQVIYFSALQLLISSKNIA